MKSKTRTERQDYPVMQTAINTTIIQTNERDKKANDFYHFVSLMRVGYLTATAINRYIEIPINNLRMCDLNFIHNRCTAILGVNVGTHIFSAEICDRLRGIKQEIEQEILRRFEESALRDAPRSRIKKPKVPYKGEDTLAYDGGGVTIDEL